MLTSQALYLDLVEERAMFDRVHHVAYTVRDLEEYREFFGETLEMTEEAVREMPEAGYNAAVFRVGETLIEVQEPTDNEGMEAFLDEHGNGLNHVAYEVPDMDAAVETLGEKGIVPDSEWGEGGEPIEAPTFPGCLLLDMDEESADGIYLQLVETPE